MRLSTALKLAAVAAAALTIGLVAAAKSFDMKRIKVLLAEQTRAATGRELVIAGPLELRLGLIPKIIATGITLSNAPGGSRAEMIKIERAEAELSLLPLFKREIRINRLVVSAPDILLETDARGRPNWSFTPAAQPAPAADPKGKGLPTTRFTLREAKIKNGRVTWRDGASGASRMVAVHKLAVQPDASAGAPLVVQVIGDVDSKFFDLSGKVGGMSALSQSKPWPVQLKGSFDGMVLVADGSVADPLARQGVDIALTVQGDELGNVAKLAGHTRAGAPLPLGPFKLSGRLSDASGKFALADLDMALGKRDALVVGARGAIKDLAALSGVDLAVAVESDNLAGLSRLAGADMPSMGPLKVTGMLTGGGGAWKLADIKAHLAGSDAVGELALDLAGRPLLTGKLSAANLAVADFATPAAKPGEKLAPKHLKGVENGRLFPAEALPLDILRLADAELALHAGRFDLGGLRLTDAGADIRLTGGRLTVKPFHAVVGGGLVEGESVLDASATPAGLTLRLTARQVELGRLAKEAGSTFITGAPSDAKLELRSKGASLRDLLADASGEVVVSVGEGRVKNSAVDWAGGDALFQVLGALNPLAKQEDTTQLNCAVSRFTIKDGIATASRGIAVETAKVQVVGAGTVDLRNEALDLGFTPRARDGIGVSLSSPLAGMTRLRGTLAHPTIGIDEVGTVRTAASVGAAMATGGLSLLGELVVDKFTADPTPCLTALGRPPAKKAPKKGIGAFEGLFGR